ncbi:MULTISPECIES: lysylphosphatidylglycerol synthase transmembrane domain-containing protein [unclassified Enterococcus]|uniref:lysylphosphatidylglycerol synthase transmembrane domain-containing protein n=1 Tax=unclassified Enterococcus TaxID=2608891 RepID=UPI0013EB97A5|nr:MULTISPECIES: lysylphosphatidylglycerol synthase transmembrane domain-containing protein [unclassified Enterococcus]
MSNKGTKTKLFLNLLLLIAIFAIIYYLINQSFAEIFEELLSTSLIVLAATILLGTIYQIAEGRSIQEIAKPFAPDFSTKDGFIASCYIAFYRIVSFGTGTLISEIYFYNKKGMKLSQGAGVTALHMIMYKLAVITYAVLGLIIQFSLFYSNSPSMIWFIIAGILLTIVIVAFLLVMSISLNVQVFFVSLSNRLFKSERLRNWVDTCNMQIYSLRETVQTIVQDRTALLRIYLWNMIKLVFWYVLPYLILIENHPRIDFLLTFSFISFSVVLSGVIPTPAGIGSFEFVYLLLFKPVVGTVDAVSSLLLYRFSSFILPFIYGFVYVIAERRRVIKEELKEVKKEK